MYQSLMDHRSHVLGRLVRKGEILDVPEDVARANQSLYRKMDEKESRKVVETMSREQAAKIVTDRKLAKAEEIPTLSTKQLRELAESGGF